MGFPNRYAALPRTSTDSNLSNVTEENENVRLDVYAPQLGSSFSFRAFPLPFWFLASVSIVCSFLTLLAEVLRMVGSIKHGSNNSGNRQLMAPIIAFTSFDILVHLIVLLFHVFVLVLTHCFHLKLVSTKPPSMQSGRSSNPWDKVPPIVITVLYLFEVFVIITLIVGLWIAAATTWKIPSIVPGQIFGWIAVVSRIAALLHKTKLSVSFGDPKPISLSPDNLSQSYQDPEEGNGRVQDGEVSVGQQQAKGLI